MQSHHYPCNPQQISGADIVEMLCYILDVLHSLSFQSDEGGTDHHNDMTLLRRNYISLMLHILQLKSAYELLIFLDKAGYFSAITNSLVNFCYESDYLAQRSALSSVVKLVGVWGKGELGDCYGDYSTDMWKVDPAECSSPLQDGAFMDDFKTEANGGKNAPLPGFTPFLLEKVVPMLFGVLETSNLKAGDSRTRCIIAEVTKAHFEILRFQGYKYPYYLGKVFFRSMPVPSPYANNFLTVLSSNDQKACNNLLTSYATHLSANPK